MVNYDLSRHKRQFWTSRDHEEGLYRRHDIKEFLEVLKASFDDVGLYNGTTIQRRIDQLAGDDFKDE